MISRQVGPSADMGTAQQTVLVHRSSTLITAGFQFISFRVSFGIIAPTQCTGGTSWISIIHSQFRPFILSMRGVTEASSSFSI